MNVLKVENLNFSYGTNSILNNLTLKVNTGDFLAIVGSNGSGKSTLMKLCLGLMKPNKGLISLFGIDINKFKAWSNVGYIPQKATSFNQGFPATVEEVIAANLKDRGFGASITRKNADKLDEVLETVGMREYKKRLIGKLSGGQQQRIFIAKALISEPKVIFMDEPTVGIDKESQKSFYELMEYLNKSRNITIIMVTHDLGDIRKKVNRLVDITDGKLSETDLEK